MFSTMGAIAQKAQNGRPVDDTERPVALVQDLYTQVISRHPIGVIKGDDMSVFAPLIGRALRHRIDLTADCEADYFRQHPETDMKPHFGWLELGLFTGGDEMAAPSAFRVERTRPVKQGVVRVYVTLTHAQTNEPGSTKPVAVEVAREQGRYLAQDVIYLKGKNNRSDVRLSKVLAAGCDGAHWVGDGQR